MDYYYQIKGKCIHTNGWEWPPSFSGKVTAENKKDARKQIEDEYERKFDLRVLAKNFEKTDYLLRIVEISNSNDYIADLFKENKCLSCESSFRVIDKYNNPHEDNKGPEYCSRACQIKEKNKLNVIHDFGGARIRGAHIYAITNKKTNMTYVGKTTQVFTLRWYQHFYQGSGTPFHDAIAGSEVTDWIFNVVESVDVPKDADCEKFISSREAYWINEFDSLNNGYNTMAVSCELVEKETL